MGISLNKPFLISSFVILFVPSLFAAIPPAQTEKASAGLSAEEILTMPEQNRYILTQRKVEQYYPALIEISKSAQQTLDMRWKALTLAAYLKKSQSMPEMQAALKAPEWFMRNAALIAVQSFDPTAAKTAAKELIKDKALVVRSAAVDVLKNDLDPKTRELLWSELDAPYNFKAAQGLWVRDQILENLALQPEKRETDQFVKVLAKDGAGLHQPAMAALEKISGKIMGTKKSTLNQRKELWIQWAKANPNFGVL